MQEPSDIRLGKLELEIMKVVWENGQATVAEVQQGLSQRQPRAYTTILTMMRKLEAKGYLSHTNAERTFVYHAALSQEKVRRSALKDMIERVFDGSAQLLVSGLIDYKKLNARETEEIRKLINQRTVPRDRK